jgi:hypothetical protein
MRGLHSGRAAERGGFRLVHGRPPAGECPSFGQPVEHLVYGWDVRVAQAQPPARGLAQEPPPGNRAARLELLQARPEQVGADLLGGVPVGELDA